MRTPEVCPPRHEARCREDAVAHAETDTERNARRRAATLAVLDQAAAEARRQAEPERESDYSSTRLWDACMALIEAAEDTLAAYFHR